MRALFGGFRQYVKEQNVPEIRKFISSYVEKVIIYKDHVEVVFFFCAGAVQKKNVRLVVNIRENR